MNDYALRTRLLWILTASVAACTPSKDGAQPQLAPAHSATPTGPASASDVPPSQGTGQAPSTQADASSPKPVAHPLPNEALTSGPTPTSPAQTATATKPPPPTRTCDKPERRCFAPRTNTSGGNIIAPLPAELFDANGCQPAERVGGSCAGYRAISGPKVVAGECCYQGCASNPAPCGRPLFADGTARAAPLERGNGAWIT